MECLVIGRGKEGSKNAYIYLYISKSLGHFPECDVIRRVRVVHANPKITPWAGHETCQKISVLETLHLSYASWNKVSEETIRNCFRHDGFSATEEEMETYSPEDLSHEDCENWIHIDADLDFA